MQAAMAAIAFSATLMDNSRDANQFYTTSKVVRATFHNHFVDMANGLTGVQDLIVDILEKNNSVFPAKVLALEKDENGIEQPHALLPIAKAGGMFTEDIMAEVQRRFAAGSIRYPLQTVKNYLSTDMFRAGIVGKIRLTKFEDSARKCLRPRNVWFLIAK